MTEAVPATELGATVQNAPDGEIVGHPGEPTSAPSLAPARGRPRWKVPVADQAERETDPQAQPAPDYESDQRVAW